MLLAGNTTTSLSGWYVGMGVTAAIIVVVVVLVAIILGLARRIGAQALAVTLALDDARKTTLALWDVSKINDGLKDIVRSAAAARELLEGS